jgi:Mg2+ and Co2+ transporter CorA
MRKIRDRGLLKSQVYRVFNDDLMIGLAAILACTVILPLFIEFTPAMETIFEAVNYAIISIFAAEYVFKLIVDDKKVSFVINSWHILDLLIIVIAVLDLSKLSFIPFVISEQGKLSPILRLLRVLLRVLLAITLAGRTAERAIPIKLPENNPSLKSQLRISTLDFQGNISKCFVKESSCTIPKTGKPLWIDFQHVGKIDLDFIEKNTAIPIDVLESKLIKESFPRIDHIKGVPIIFLWDSKVNEINSDVNELNVTKNDMLIVFENNRIITLSSGESHLFDTISYESLPLENEEFSIQILYSLLHKKIDDYGEIVQRIEQKTIGFEEIPVNRTSPQFLEETFHFKKEIQKIISNLWHFHQILHHLKDDKNLVNKINNKDSYYFDNLHAESEYMYETAQNIKESLLSIIDLHINTVSYDMNRVMKVIAVITCLAIIPATIGGLLGVNLTQGNFPIKLSEVLYL